MGTRNGVVETLVIDAAKAAWSWLSWAAVAFVVQPARLVAVWIRPGERELAIARDVRRTVTSAVVNAVAWVGDRLATVEPVLDRTLDRGQQLLVLGLVLVRDGVAWFMPRLVRLGVTVPNSLWFMVLLVAWLLRLAWPVAVNVAVGTWAVLAWLGRLVASIDFRRAVETPEPGVMRDGRGVPVAIPLERPAFRENLRRAA